MKINWNEPKFEGREKELVGKVLDSGYVSEGFYTHELEEQLAEIVGTKHVIMTTSCTAALTLAIEAHKNLSENPVEKVVIPSLTFVATKNAVENAGLEIVYSEVSQDRFVMDIGVSDNNFLYIPVNLLGRKCEVDEKNVIYDNAGALGSNVPNGKVGCYSLQGNKIISCGQGGFCATDDDDYATEIRRLKDFGREEKLQNDSTGFNFKFNDILAAVALGQLEKLEERKNLHCQQYAIYKRELEKFGGFVEFNIVDGEIPLWIEFICKDEEERLSLSKHLNSQGISCRYPWEPLSDKTPVSQSYYKKVLWLPNGPAITSEDLNEIIKEVRKFYEGKKS